MIYAVIFVCLAAFVAACAAGAVVFRTVLRHASEVIDL